MAKNKIKEIQRKYNHLKRRLPRTIGQVAVNFSKDNFRRQGFLDGGRVNKWKKRKFSGGNEGKALLTQSGKLKKSIAIIRASPSEIVIGTKGIPYGRIHNEGGQINQKVTNKQRAFFWAKYKASGNELYKRMAMSTKLEIRIPRRKFIGNSTDLQQQMARKIKLELLKIFK
ncbi:phage virion morphogenesis protein [Aureispira sp. CCB-QB1]|uniref:phage virion morphogenesis protein n=1 Tax=Aureispira sp. CCB-QB1 TaxID=1313421 RepID=UPI000698DF9D|nr:phage virion morphogenesis protein [Aureispira sp. CCB-QB1]